MKKIILVLLLMLSINAFAQTEADVLNQANNLIEDKKYETAFLLLDKFDSTNSNPNIVLMKESILLNYFVSTTGHLAFALIDIDKNDNINDYRAMEGDYTLRPFRIDSILYSLLEKYPNNCNINKGLGDYYLQIFQIYKEKALIPVNQLSQLISDNYKKADDGKCADFISYYGLGLMNLMNNQYEVANKYFLKSIELNPNYADSYYDLAYSYTQLKENDKALENALNAYKLYNVNQQRSDAARLVGGLYFLKNDDTNAVKYYEIANSVLPYDYTSVKQLLELYLKLEHTKRTEYTKFFLLLDPFNPTIYNDLANLYLNYNKRQELIDFYKTELNSKVYNDIINGNFNFYLGSLYSDIDKHLSKTYYTEAQTILSKFYPKDHQVFREIEKALK